jgi:hypothetical protein
MFGFPLPWLSHQTVAVAGSVDIWLTLLSNLLIDYAFWFIISATTIVV